MAAAHPHTPAVTAPPDADRTPPLRLSIALLTAIFAIFPFNLHWSGPRSSYDVSTVVSLTDIGFAATLIASGGRMWRRRRRCGSGVAILLWTALAAVMTVSWLVHPSMRGAHSLLELWGTGALADCLLEGLTDGFGPLVLGVLGGIAVVEAAWSAAQVISGSTLGLSRLSGSDPFHHFSASVEAPAGSMTQIYLLAALALVAGGALAAYGTTTPRPRVAFLAAAMAIVPIGYTFSRAGLLGFVLLLGALGIGALRQNGRGRYVAAAIALSVGAAVPAAVWHAGWQLRSDQTTAASSVNGLTTERGSLIHQGLELVHSEPVTGVGPGRYVIALAGRLHEPTSAYLQPVHNVALLAEVEGGPLAGLVVVLLLAVAGWRTIRAGPAALALYLAYLPFFIFDALPYLYPQGLIITAVWLSVLDWQVSASRQPVPLLE